MAKENHELGGQGLKPQFCPSPGGAAVCAAVCSGGGLSQLRSFVAVAEPRVWRGLLECGLPLGPPALPRPSPPVASAPVLFHSHEREEAGGQVEGGVGSGEEEGAREAAAGCQRAAGQQQEACQERYPWPWRCSAPGAEGSGRERAADLGLRLWLHLLTSCVSLEEAVDTPPHPRNPDFLICKLGPEPGPAGRLST